MDSFYFKFCICLPRESPLLISIPFVNIFLGIFYFILLFKTLSGKYDYELIMNFY